MFSTRPFATLLVLCAATSLVVSDWVNWMPEHLQDYDCTGVPDGVQEIGCWGRLDCKNSQISFLGCYPKRVYSRDLNKCVTPGDKTTDCSVSTFCDKRPDGLYGDIDDGCQTFFTCWKGQFLGREYCPSNLRFNSALHVCDYKARVTCTT